MGFNLFGNSKPDIIRVDVANSNEKSRMQAPPVDDIQTAYDALQKRFIITKDSFNNQNTPEVVLANLMFANLVELNKLNRELALLRLYKQE